MLSAINHVSEMKLIARHKAIKQIAISKNPNFAKYFHTRVLEVIGPNNHPNDNMNIMVNRKYYRKKALQKINLFNWRQ